MIDPVTGVETASPTVITDTPEFKAALKAERDRLEQNIRESNQTHLAKKEAELEAAVAERNRGPIPSGAGNGKDYFSDWGERHGLPAEAGRELAMGILGHVQREVLPKELKPITDRQKQQSIRFQRQELRAANAKLSKLDDRYHAEALKMVEALRPEQIGDDSYAKALQMIIGSHVEELMEPAAKPAEKEPEIVPGVEPQGSAPAPKKTVSLNAEQKRFVEERGVSEEDFVVMMRERAQALELKGYSKSQARGRLGSLLGAIEF